MNIPKLRFKDNNGNDYPQWEKKKLGDIVQFLDNKRKPLEQSERIHGKYPYYGASGIIDYINNYIFDEELVLLSEDGANIIDRNYPICYIATGKYWVNNHAHVLKTKSQYLNKFLCEALERLNYNKYNTGTAQPKLNQDICKNILLNIPILHEQEKIANFFSTIDKKIKNLANTITSLENQKKGLLQQIFSQKLRFKDKNGNNYPNWKKKKLGDIATLKNGISKSNEAFGHGKKFINLQDIFNKSYIFNGNYSLVDVTEKELSENNLLKGDVLFVRSSVKREGVGLPCVIMENLIDTVYSGFIIRCRFNINENIYLHYKKYCFLEFSFRKALLKKSSSSANTNINQDNLSKLYVKLPCLEEQTKIADFLSAFDRKLDNQKAQLEHWQQIKKGLLQQMFV